MGMFDKDKIFAPDGRLDEVYPPGEVGGDGSIKFVLWGVEDMGDFDTKVGVARMTHLTVSEILEPENKKTLGTLSKPIAEKAAEAEPADFPCVVFTKRVETEQQPALVLQWVREYDPALETGTKASKAKATA